MFTTVLKRQTPVKLVTASKPYVPNLSLSQESCSTGTNITKEDIFRVRVPGWGSRHHLNTVGVASEVQEVVFVALRSWIMLEELPDISPWLMYILGLILEGWTSLSTRDGRRFELFPRSLT